MAPGKKRRRGRKKRGRTLRNDKWFDPTIKEPDTGKKGKRGREREKKGRLLI